ncbi:hypothetical protein FB45DRAFT_1053503 [Roridomyces roridus]|uniref:Uncharacterized protein n=1 Tax=Roridomyces roridus TaxID=1738132 RepID=A0AAD7FYP8_9AGAR|nr:hypothetical protein FB45DRAFT_1053503 [Roridomyces roridus]
MSVPMLRRRLCNKIPDGIPREPATAQHFRYKVRLGSRYSHYLNTSRSKDGIHLFLLPSPSSALKKRQHPLTSTMKFSIFFVATAVALASQVSAATIGGTTIAAAGTTGTTNVGNSPATGTKVFTTNTNTNTGTGTNTNVNTNTNVGEGTTGTVGIKTGTGTQPEGTQTTAGGTNTGAVDPLQTTSTPVGGTVNTQGTDTSTSTTSPGAPAETESDDVPPGTTPTSAPTSGLDDTNALSNNINGGRSLGVGMSAIGVGAGILASVLLA